MLDFSLKKKNNKLFHKQAGSRLLCAMMEERFVFYTFIFSPAETERA